MLYSYDLCGVVVAVRRPLVLNFNRTNTNYFFMTLQAMLSDAVYATSPVIVHFENGNATETRFDEGRV